MRQWNRVQRKAGYSSLFTRCSTMYAAMGLLEAGGLKLSKGPRKNAERGGKTLSGSR